MGSEPEKARSEPVATYVDRNDADMQALLTGKLVHQDSCIYVAAPQGKAKWILVASRFSTRWDAPRLIYDGRAVRLGERISIGGGAVAFKRGSDEGIDVHKSCAGDHYWFAGELQSG